VDSKFFLKQCDPLETVGKGSRDILALDYSVAMNPLGRWAKCRLVDPASRESELVAWVEAQMWVFHQPPWGF
jgi:hypothetical protein